jgi:hypothetical protein
MNAQEYSELETRLAQALQHSAASTMATANALDGLDRFHASTSRRRVRARVLAAVAAVLLVVGGSATAVAVIGTGPSRGHLPATHRHSAAAHRSTLGPAKPLARTVQVSNVNGPEYLGVAAFGDIWATADGHPADLYRLSADGHRMLSETGYAGVGLNQGAPVRIGSSIVVSESRSGQYAVFNSTGHKVGTLPNLGEGAATGDASGGWIATDAEQVARVDSTGRHIVDRFTLPIPSISGLATSPGRLWVISSALSQLVRVDPSTGKVTGHVELPSSPTQVVYTGGAVYVAGHDFGLRRIDPSTLAITATAFSQSKGSWPVIAAATGGQLWVQGTEGSIAQLDPTTLRAERNIEIFNDNQSVATADGAVVTASRIFVTDQGQTYSFPLRPGE